MFVNYQILPLYTGIYIIIDFEIALFKINHIMNIELPSYTPIR